MYCMDFNSGNLLATGGGDNDIKLWEVSAGIYVFSSNQPEASVSTHRGKVATMPSIGLLPVARGSAMAM